MPGAAPQYTDSMSRLLLLFALAVPFASAQNPLADDSRFVWGNVSNYIVRAAEKMPAEKYSFKPTDSVMTFAELVGHLADSNYMFCATASGERPPASNVRKEMSTKEQIVPALKESVAYCNKVYSALTDASALEKVKMFGGERTRAGVLAFHSGHAYEHYGNLVTYLRINGLVPPSSEPRR